MLLAGSGFALYQSPNNHTIVTTAPLARSGAAGGMLSSARLTGQTLGAVVLATIFTFAGGHGGHAEIVALAVAGCFAGLAGGRERTQLHTHHPLILYSPLSFAKKKLSMKC